MVNLTETWFPNHRHSSRARLLLFCFPHAGGTAASFASWPDQLPASIEVRPLQLPGRANRIIEPSIENFDDLVRQLGPIVRGAIDRPFALFGHSMGALLAFQVARFLRRFGALTPKHLYISGRRAPQYSHPAFASDDSDEALVERVRELSGTPRELLDDPEIVSLVLPALRADLAVCRTFTYSEEPPLDCPITVFAGQDDEEGHDGRAEGWGRHTTVSSQVHRFPGGHFYLLTDERRLTSLVAATLQCAIEEVTDGHHVISGNDDPFAGRER